MAKATTKSKSAEARITDLEDRLWALGLQVQELEQQIRLSLNDGLPAHLTLSDAMERIIEVATWGNERRGKGGGTPWITNSPTTRLRLVVTKEGVVVIYVSLRVGPGYIYTTSRDSGFRPEETYTGLLNGYFEDAYQECLQLFRLDRLRRRLAAERKHG